ncbi:unnamed protein product [Sphagnum balticum]
MIWRVDQQPTSISLLPQPVQTTGLNDGVAQLWLDLFVGRDYLKHTGPWLNITDDPQFTVGVQFQMNLLSITEVVVLMQQETLVASCPMDVTNFPFDTQNCTLTYRSQYYNNVLLDIAQNGESSAADFESNNGSDHNPTLPQLLCDDIRHAHTVDHVAGTVR